MFGGTGMEFALSIATGLTVGLMAHRVWYAPLVGVGTQVGWVAYSVSGHIGLLPLSLVLLVIYLIATVRWRRFNASRSVHH